jgi:hypothetical protein
MTAEALVAGLCFAAVLSWPRKPRGGAGQLSRAAAGSDAREPAGARSRPALEPDFVMDLAACGLRAGLPLGEALACAARAADGPGDDRRDGSARKGAPASAGYLTGVVGRLRLGVPGREAWGLAPPDYAGLARAMLLAELSGAPAASVVARAATDLRVARRERAELAAARLGVRLVLPLGLAILPGFVLLAVVPIILGLASSLLQSAS